MQFGFRAAESLDGGNSEAVQRAHWSKTCIGRIMSNTKCNSVIKSIFRCTSLYTGQFCQLLMQCVLYTKYKQHIQTSKHTRMDPEISGKWRIITNRRTKAPTDIGHLMEVPAAFPGKFWIIWCQYFCIFHFWHFLLIKVMFSKRHVIYYIIIQLSKSNWLW